MKDSIYKILQERYFIPGEKEWDDIAKRVSCNNLEIYPHISKMEFIPSSPTLMNCNTNGYKIGTLSSCFTMKIEDSIEGIFEAVKETAIVTKYGGGVGYDFSDLRGSNEIVNGIGRLSSGPLPFINVFNSALDGIMQGGIRRGAGMAMLDIDHPDILSFISAKSKINVFSRFNFSVRVSDEFYYKLENEPNSIWLVKNRIDKKLFPLKDSSGKEITVKELWNIIIEKAWETGEPGIFNSDIATRQCTVTNVDSHVLSNPCAEYISIPYGSCNLGSINFSKFVYNRKFNWDLFEQLIVKATSYLDSLIDINQYPIQKIKETTLKIRPIGLGFMGVAHALFKKGIKYNSEKGYEFIENVTRYLTLRSMKQSVELAKQYGAYEAFDYNTYMKANERFFNKGNCRNIDVDVLANDIKKYGVRNSVTTSIAPTGTISFIADTSSGIEPVFALSYMRKIEKNNKEYETVYISDPVFEEYINNNFDEEKRKEILKYIVDNKGSCQNCHHLPEEIQNIFVVAGDIQPLEHLESLSRCAVNSSTSVSKTINLPNSATKDEVSKVYINAYKKGIIGVTVYRDGSREGILLHKTDKRPKAIVYHHAPKRPTRVECDVHRITYKGEKWIAFIGLCGAEGVDTKVPFEIFCGKVDDVNLHHKITKGYLIKVESGHYSFEYDGEILIKNISKTFNNEDNDDFARSISLSLRSGVMIQHICDTLSKSKGDITKFSKVLMRILKYYIQDGMAASGRCEICGSKLVYKEGCISCINPECGYSKCG